MKDILETCISRMEQLMDVLEREAFRTDSINESQRLFREVELVKQDIFDAQKVDEKKDEIFTDIQMQDAIKEGILAGYEAARNRDEINVSQWAKDYIIGLQNS